MTVRTQTREAIAVETANARHKFTYLEKAEEGRKGGGKSLGNGQLVRVGVTRIKSPETDSCYEKENEASCDSINISEL